MSLLSRFYILKTASSEVNKRTIFKQSWTIHIPDFFFAFCFATSIFAAQTFDKILAVLIFFFGHSWIGAIVFATFVIVPSVCLLWFEKNHEDCIPGYKMRSWCLAVLIFVGVGPFLICGNALKNFFENQNELQVPLKWHSLPMFYIKNKDMCLMKVYCLFHVALKTIPQFYIVSVLILKRYITGALAILGLFSLLANMVIFSLTMAVTFPLRSTPRVYTTSFCILLNAFCKFMATICGCGINLTIFTMLFSSIGYYALLTHAVKSLLWIWPSWWVLNTQPYVLTPFYFSLYLFFLTLIFSIIYIHPFEGKGKLIYYFFYLMKFLSELFCIYILTDAECKATSTYLVLLAVMLGYLSCYGSTNILLKYKLNKFGCEVDFEAQTKKENEGKIDSVQENKLQANMENSKKEDKSNIKDQESQTP